VDTTGVLFRIIQGNGSTSTPNIEVLNLREANSPVNFTSSLASNAGWLLLGHENSTISGNNTGPSPADARPVPLNSHPEPNTGWSKSHPNT
jgi:hypothetical protein